MELRERLTEILEAYDAGAYLPNEDANDYDAHSFVVDAILEAIKNEPAQ